MADEGLLAFRRSATSYVNSVTERPSSGIGYVDGFLESTYSGLKEMFGADPTERAEIFRAQNPVGGLVSELISPFGAYGAAFTASKKIKAFERVVEGAYEMAGGAQNAKRAAALREVVRFSPVELTRLGVGTVMADDYGELFKDVLLDTGLNAVFGAGMGFFEAAGKASTPLLKEIPGVDLKLRTPFQLQQAMKVVQASPAPAEYKVALDDLVERVYREETGGEKYVGLIGDTGIGGVINKRGERVGDHLHGLFVPGDTPTMAKRKLLVGKRGFESDEELNGFLKAAGIDRQADAPFVLFPRAVQAKNLDSAKRLSGTIVNQMAEASPGIFYAKEKDGLFVVAKKVQGRIGKVGDQVPVGPAVEGTPQKMRTVKTPSTAAKAASAEGDAWVVFKTADPQRFAPIADRHRKLMIADAAKMKQAFAEPPTFSKSILVQQMQTLMRNISFRTFGAQADEKSLLGEARKLLGPAGAKLPDNSPVLQGMKKTLWEKMLPTVYQEGLGDTRFSRAMALYRGMLSTAENMANRVAFGRPQMKEGSSFWKTIFATGTEQRKFDETTESLLGVMSRISEQDLNDAMRAAYSGVELENIPEMVAKGELTQGAADFLQTSSKLDRWHVEQLESALQFADEKLAKNFNARKNYYLLPRIYRGTRRTEVLDSNGKVIALGSGRNNLMSEREADAIATQLRESGVDAKARVGKSFDSDTWDDPTRTLDGEFGMKVRRAVTAALRNPPKSFLARTGMKGTPDFTNYTKEEVLKAVYSHVRTQHAHAAYNVHRKMFGDELRVLAQNNPEQLAEFERRVNDSMGVNGPFAKLQNEVLDKALAPVLGKNSASKIAGAVNGLIFWFQLGLFNPTFVVLNALTPLQTVLPHISYTLRAPNAVKEAYMSWWPVIGPEGPKGQIAHVNPLKLMYRGFRAMGNPDAGLRAAYERALGDGKVDPKLFEEFVGQQARTVLELKSTLSEPGGYVNFMKAVASYLPAKSEMFSRSYAFATNYLLGRDVIGLTDEALYQFAARQTDLTMFNYATMDRARLITGPVGSVLGLFKNWQMHYIGMMVQYAGLGLKQNIWGPLAWQAGATAAIAGVGGTPYAPIVDGFASWAGSDTFTRDGQRWGDSGASDALWQGLPALLGVSLQGSGSMPGADPVRDATMFFSVVHLDRGRALGSALGDSYDYWRTTGRSPFENPNISDQFQRALAPRAIYRATSVAEGDYLNSMTTGYPLLREVGSFHRWLYGMGFNPVEIEKQFEIADVLHKEDQKMRTAVQNYGEMYAQATLAGNYKDAQRAITLATMQGVPLDRVMSSAAARMQREQQGDIFDRISPDVLRQYGM